MISSPVYIWCDDYILALKCLQTLYIHYTVHVECFMVWIHLIVLSCSHWHQWCVLQGRATSLYWRYWWNMGEMCFTKRKWVTLGSGTHKLTQRSTHDTNHVHRVHSLPFTLLPMVDPLSLLSTCCPSLETGSLSWMRMVGHAFTMQLEVVASQWWGTSWTSVDLTSAWEMRWVVEWYMTLCMCLWFVDKTQCM